MTSLRATLRDPVLWTDASQLAKTVAAAVIAWVLANHAFGIAQPFLAPWAALLTVNATVYRTFARGAQQVGATVLGVLLAFAVGNVLGVSAWSLGLMLLVAMLAGSARGLRGESTTAAATALVVLLTGYSANDHILGARLLDTVIGIGVGLLVNLVVWPPLRDRAAARRVDRIDDELGALLTDMADRLHERDDGDAVDDWVERTRDLDHDIDAAWATVRQARESGRLNPRLSAAARMRRSDAFGDVLGRLEQAVAETRSMARTITRANSSVGGDDDFRARWTDLLRRAGAAVSDADSAAIGEIRVDLEAAAEGEHRPARGALLVNLHNILDAMDAVADAQPVRADVRHLALS
ncbi:MAG TPA: aromatic acid exporter family protein [Solirubrobacteraceae bacterium]|nr:aromatic acid exporter family protein [Solirubrobacteraceae bacterium]